AVNTFKEKFIGKSTWGWDAVTNCFITSASATHVELKLMIAYRNWANIPGTFSVSMSFDSFGTTSDGSKLWKLTANSYHHTYDGWWGTYIDSSVKDAFANGITVSKFDPNAGRANHSFSQDRICDVLADRLRVARAGNAVFREGLERTADGFIVRYSVRTP